MANVQEFKGYTITREFCPEAPSLYEYVVTKEGTERYVPFGSLSEAKAWVRAETKGGAE